MSTGYPLARALLEGAGGQSSALAELEEQLERLTARSKDAWPGIVVPADDLARHAGAFLASAGVPVIEIDIALAKLHYDDLYLALACARGDVAAIERFEATFAPVIAAALARRRLTPTLTTEITQVVRHKLFVGDETSKGRIADYSGRGPLAAWVRVVAVRTALHALEREKREVGLEDDALEAAAATDRDPELAPLVEQYKVEFKAAFQEALAALGAGERLLLRQHYVDGLTMDELAEMRGIHRVTLIRRMNRVRESLGDATRALLFQRLRMDGRDVASVYRLVKSQLDVSIKRFL